MESTQIQALYEPPPAAMPQLSEKPCQGFETRKTAGKPGSSSCNFTVTLGLRATVVENGVRKTYSARYYNPLTGRFMSRDPEDGKAWEPKSLHKYLYALGDPVNRIDPRGRDSILETGSLDVFVGTTPVPALVELAGGAYASSAAWATNQYLLYAASTTNVVAAVSDFIEAVDWAELVSGISKAYLCIRLEDFLFDQLYSAIDMEGYNGPDTLLGQKAKDKFEDTCWVIAGKAL
jgi:RHS repeat-associated protein